MKHCMEFLYQVNFKIKGWLLWKHSYAVRSLVELVPFLLKIPGVKSFLSEHLYQDPLEKYFGMQRQKGGTNANPNVSQFLKNNQTLRVVNTTAANVPRGNCRGRRGCINVDDDNTPLPKRRRQHK